MSPYKSRYFGLWNRFMQSDTEVMDDLAASIFKMKWRWKHRRTLIPPSSGWSEDGGIGGPFCLHLQGEVQMEASEDLNASIFKMKWRWKHRRTFLPPSSGWSEDEAIGGPYYLHLQGEVKEASDDLATYIFRVKQRWRQQGPPKHWHPTTSLDGVTIQKTTTLIYPAVKALHLSMH
jgi:hypothetical protein